MSRTRYSLTTDHYEYKLLSPEHHLNWMNIHKFTRNILLFYQPQRQVPKWMHPSDWPSHCAILLWHTAPTVQNRCCRMDNQIYLGRSSFDVIEACYNWLFCNSYWVQYNILDPAKVIVQSTKNFPKGLSAEGPKFKIRRLKACDSEAFLDPKKNLNTQESFYLIQN